MSSLSELKFLIRSDLFRYKGKSGIKAFATSYLTNPAFHFLCCLRCARYVRFHPFFKIFYPFFAWRLHALRIRYGLAIFSSTDIGPGFLIGHIGGIVINSEAIIGKNCTILHGVTLGDSDRKDRPGAPVLGDYVYVGAGAKIIGRVKVGHHAVIGANCVVTKDVPDEAVVVGVPGKVVSYKGSFDLIQNIQYES